MKILSRFRLICTFLLFFLTIPFAFAAKAEIAIFAAGCFWCAEHDFEQVPGVLKVVSGYTGGSTNDPTYEQVSQGETGHFEAVEVYYDPEKISYSQLLNIFWHNVDPLDGDGQFCDRGDQYRAAIFYQNEEEKKLAEASKQELLTSGKFKKIQTLILPAKTFYPAEAYHQGYAEKNPLKYKYYRYRCGRDARLAERWNSN